ncbi:prostate and testis expressed protein 3 [Trichechus manatus latirostris]|uniref:Prostate and testis expressed protein 3 n=1 Tax=Trichechus manatus latirostris TaxID=127582 RepID=A0A2Y9R2Q1_TRIMA|nr:prostate and testis expressed protein 3 [Trichechus manatus latirostris]
MDKPVLLAFYLICVTVGTSLKCLTCHLRVKADRCRRGFGVCIAQDDEMCMSLKIYRGEELLVAYMECQKFCKAARVKRKGRIYVHSCCARNYCNGKI